MIIPDLRIVVPVGRITKSIVREIEVIGNSLTRYQPTWVEQGVVGRADQPHNENVLKARRLDTTYCETPQGQVGHVKRKLLSYERVRGMVFGAFREASIPVHQLVDSLANLCLSGSAAEGKDEVCGTVAGERAIVVGQLRGKLSVASIRAQCIGVDRNGAGRGCY